MYDIGMESSTESTVSSESELSNESSTPSFLPSSYIKTYMSTVQHTPDSVMREVTRIMELDVKVQRQLREIDQIKHTMKTTGHTRAELREDIQQVKSRLDRVLLLEEMKSDCVRVIQGLIEQAGGALDEDQMQLLQLKILDTDTPSPICSNNEDQGEDSPAIAEDDDDNSSGVRKLTKRTSSSASRGRGGGGGGGRRSVQRNLVKDNEDEDSSASRPASTRKKPARKRRERKSSPTPPELDPPDSDEPRYCSCNEVSYGEMIGCDNNSCPIEWFHFRCVNLTAKPKGKWFCPNCSTEKKKS